MKPRWYQHPFLWFALVALVGLSGCATPSSGGEASAISITNSPGASINIRGDGNGTATAAPESEGTSASASAPIDVSVPLVK